LKEYVGRRNEKLIERHHHVDIDKNTILGKVKLQELNLREKLNLRPGSKLPEERRSTQLAICITMYNEPYKQLLETMAGVYRSIYELYELDGERYYEKIHTFII
jgi:hypothetical protein